MNNFRLSSPLELLAFAAHVIRQGDSKAESLLGAYQVSKSDRAFEKLRAHLQGYNPDSTAIAAAVMAQKKSAKASAPAEAKNPDGVFKTNRQLVSELKAANERVRNLEARAAATSRQPVTRSTTPAKGARLPVTKRTVVPKPGRTAAQLMANPHPSKLIRQAQTSPTAAEEIRAAYDALSAGPERIAFRNRFETILRNS